LGLALYPPVLPVTDGGLVVELFDLEVPAPAMLPRLSGPEYPPMGFLFPPALPPPDTGFLFADVETAVDEALGPS
jgi:hypothetical protein